MARQKLLIALGATALLAWESAAGPKGPGGAGGGGGGTYPTSGASQTVGGIPAAALEYNRTLGFLKSYAAKLEKSHGERLPDIREPLQQIQRDAKFLQQKWLDWSQRNARRSAYATDVKRDPYFRTLEASQRQLKDAARQGDAEILQTVKEVAADLHAKAENCRHSADGLGNNIRLIVCTKQGADEVAGFEVWCAPVALVQFKEDHRRFPKLSNPTTTIEGVPPGCYQVWARRDVEKSAIALQTIGGNGEKEVSMDLPVSIGWKRPQ
jgi:hypothetical protein